MRYYIIAGEASGDLHASNLMKVLKSIDNEPVFQGFGGDLMQNQGLKVVKHYKDLDFMGFVKVALNLRTVLNNIALCKKDILAFRPDIVILVDYPGFNLRIAKFLKKRNIKNFYYISPQVWAWKQSRVRQIKKNVDRMFVILPFEKDFYAKFNYDVDFVGHPLLDALHNESKDWNRKQFIEENQLDSMKPIVALLPGSRPQEIKTMLPVMTSLSSDFPDFQFVIAGVKTADKSLYNTYLSSNVKIVFQKTHSLLRSSDAALVTSGTASLETALLKIPEVICYKGDYISYLIARKLIKVNYIGLPNLIMNKPVVKELIQNEFNKEFIAKEFTKLFEPKNRSKILDDYEKLIVKLGGPGASERAAQLMYQALEKSS
ncbi:MAG: lipid-A-disaccharide synthase [Bacteroidales bacterium]|jgi:lipid-A-disaccharide synthase|nr:lipid-A-disaccharide synthase [Bacteroidales bacterium]